MTDAVRALQGAMARFQAANCGGKRAVFGFDGYVDSLCGVVERVDAGGQRHPFASSQAFVGFLAGLGGHSAERELLLKDRRAGGNAPLTAMAAGALGVEAHCVGYMGRGALHAAFAPLTRLCTPVTLGDPAECTALEFDDCKLMLSNAETLRAFDAQALLHVVGEDRLRSLFGGAQLIAALNWSAMGGVTSALELIATDLCGESEGKTFFVDFSDLSAQPPEAFAAFAALLGRIARRAYVAVSMNAREAAAAANACGVQADGEAQLICKLRECWQVTEVVLHGMGYALCCTRDAQVRCEGVLAQHPVLTTGGGDHFNGGYCAALLAGLPPADRLDVGMAASLYYVTHGQSGTPQQIAAYLQQRQ